MEKESDDMKRFMDQHRDAFDDAALPEGLWDAIENQLPKQKTTRMVPLQSVLRVAAGVAILLAMGAYFLTKNQPQAPVVAVKEDVRQQEIIYAHYPELAEAAFYYQTKISRAETELENYHIDEQDLESVMLLEEEMKSLKVEMGDQVDNERLIKAMMQIYKYKLDMLTKMLAHIKSTENQNTTENHDDEKDAVVPL